MHVVLRLRGGGWCSPEIQDARDKEIAKAKMMTIAKGGKIKQDISPDPFPNSFWTPERTLAFNVHLLNADVFKAVTGLSPPSKPTDAKLYAEAGLPFYHLSSNNSTISGDFTAVKTIGEIDGVVDEHVVPSIVKVRGRVPPPAYAEMMENSYDPDELLDPAGPLREFRTVHDLEKGIRNLGMH